MVCYRTKQAVINGSNPTVEKYHLLIPIPYLLPNYVQSEELLRVILRT
jgi:hypothetical protein